MKIRYLTKIMKDRNKKKLEDICGKENPFLVPENYFEDFTQQLMDKLPEKGTHEIIPVKITKWQRMKPWFYMAAMFCGIIFGARYMLSSSISKNMNKVQMASQNRYDNVRELSYDEEYLEEELMNSRMDEYSVYCYLTYADSNEE